jgi:serine/threonine-protein kinase ATR
VRPFEARVHRAGKAHFLGSFATPEELTLTLTLTLTLALALALTLTPTLPLHLNPNHVAALEVARAAADKPSVGEQKHRQLPRTPTLNLTRTLTLTHPLTLTLTLAVTLTSVASPVGRRALATHVADGAQPGESPVVGLKKRSIHKKRASRP